LTAASGVVLGIAFKDGTLGVNTLWTGILVTLIGIANLRINQAHFIGNRFHTALAGNVRRALEDAILPWTVKKPSDLRLEILEKQGLDKTNVSIARIVQERINIVPVDVTALGILLVLTFVAVRVLTHSLV
jgi:hypothetical protein